MDNQKENKEYQLTEKGKELAEQLAKKNVEKDKVQAKVQESLAGEKKLSSTELKTQLNEVNRQIKEIEDLEKQKNGEWVRTKKDNTEDNQSYYKAKQIRKTGFADLMANKLLEGQGIGESFKKTLSEKTKAKMTGIKELFDPMNIAKKMTGGSKLAPALIGRITGRKQKDIEHFAGRATPLSGGTDTATKVGKVDSVSDGMVGILSKILTLMQKSYDEDKLASEESKSKEEEIKQEKERKNKAMLDVLKDKKKKENPKAEEKIEKETGGGIGDFISQLLDGFGGMKTLLNIGKFFLTNPIGIALIAGTSLMALLAKDKNPGETNKAIQNAGKVDGGLAEAIMEAGNDTVAKRKSILLRQAHKDGIIKAPWYNYKKQSAEEKSYLQSIGFDDKTGLIQKDRDNGFDAVDEDGNPYRSKSKSSATSTEKNTNTSSDMTTSSGAAGAAGGSGAAGSAGVAGVSAIPMSNENASIAGTSGVGSSDTATPQNAISNLGSQLAGATGENLDSKLNELSGAMQRGIETVTNNVVNKSVNTPASAPIPSVRNMEETFQRMILDSTRVV